MSKSLVNIKLDGEALRSNEIDVRDLAPALLGLGDLVHAANRLFNGDRADVTVKVRANKPGSFEVLLAMDVSFIESAKSILDMLAASKDGIAAAKDLSEVIFNVGTAVGTMVGGSVAGAVGMIALVKKLRGRKPDKVESQGDITIISIGDEQITAFTKAVRLAEDLAARQALRRLTTPLQKPGIDLLEVTVDDQPDTLSVVKSDEPYFELPSDDELIDQREIEMNLEIISLSFKGAHKWRVSDGSEPFMVDIEDADFLNRIDKQDVTFGKGDYLRCLVRQRQMRGSGGLKMQRTIIKVLEHNTGSRQLRLI